MPIETKLHAPNARPEWVDRPALVAQLARTTAGLILVDAPAGFGKTTLVAQWRASLAETRPFAWVSLDRGDDDPGRLWWYVVTALQRACPQIDYEAILKELRVQTPDLTGVVLPMLANELAALPGSVVLVLDDYHVIKERSCHDQVSFLLSHLPPSAQMVLITRADPALPLGRLRAAGEMAEIRARELRFAAGEAAALVHTVSGAQLSEPDLTDLMERTEGWPAGVYLAALSLRGHPSPTAFVRQFTGDNRFIVDFLVEEVLSRQPAEVQQFLVRTSILGRFCAPLCDAVTGSANSADIIERLERENLFIVPLDEIRQWFRYHHLLAQVLHGYLVRTEPGIVPDLHRRASSWHRQHGSADEAISHAIAAGDLALATDLIASHWFGYVDSGRVLTVHRWLRLLGDDQIAASPVAAHCAAWAAALSSERQSARRWLPVIEAGQDEGPLPDGMPSLRFSAALLQGVYGFDGLRAMRDAAATAVELAEDSASPWYALAQAALGFSLFLSGEPDPAEAALSAAMHAEAAYALTQIVALSTLSLIAAGMGRLPEARQLMQTAYRIAQADEFRRTPSASLAHVAAGAVLAAEGRLDEARGELSEALGARDRIPGISPWPTLEATLLLSQVLLDAGDVAGAAELTGEARRVLAALPDGAETQQARLAALEHRLAGPRRAVSAAEPLTDREITVLHLLGGSLSLREIGLELYVSANTVKTHTQAIYRKLGVSTRHEAVEQGRLLGI
ncbi:MAG TPA: LuxR C-terminal-related transcriptional regulator [Streptosporangiaceae bacterium]|nr:LuxR C-terminal-related transcriptional regulator [Streptosporangiaceae bacterium]